MRGLPRLGAGDDRFYGAADWGQLGVGEGQEVAEEFVRVAVVAGVGVWGFGLAADELVEGVVHAWPGGGGVEEGQGEGEG